MSKLTTVSLIFINCLREISSLYTQQHWAPQMEVRCSCTVQAPAILVLHRSVWWLHLHRGRKRGQFVSRSREWRVEITAAPVCVSLAVRTDRAFGAGYCRRQVELCPWPPDPLSDGLWAAVVDDCREIEQHWKPSSTLQSTILQTALKVTNNSYILHIVKNI